MKNTALAYHRLAPDYNRRWRLYLDETLERAAGYVQTESTSVSSIQLGAGRAAPSGTEFAPEKLLRVLDVGCGTGELIHKLLFQLPEAHLVGVDPAFGMLEQARRRFPADTSDVEFLRCTAERLPFPDGAFDWVTCVSSLHCFRDAEGAIIQMARVLKSPGRLLLMDWAKDSFACRLLNRWCAWFDPTHVWMYSSGELRQMLQRVGLSVEKEGHFRVPWPGRLHLWQMAAFVALKG